MKTLVVLAATTAILGSAANTVEFNMKDPKGVSGMAVSIDSLLEPVRGHATGISGQVIFDRDKPENSTGKIVVDAKSFQLGSKDLTDAMHGDWCLDVAKYPTIEFNVTKIANVKKAKDGSFNVSVTGDFKLKGVSKSITVPATVAYLPGKLKTRGGMAKDGDLIKVSSKFSIKRSDWNVSPDLSTDIIGDVIQIDLSTIGVAPK
jgi:polyisoprenoid-binding protein YceI